MAADLFPVTRPEMIAEVTREIDMRRSVYPALILRKVLSRTTAERRIAVLEAVLALLKESA